jgi:hypothetical protein
MFWMRYLPHLLLMLSVPPCFTGLNLMHMHNCSRHPVLQQTTIPQAFSPLTAVGYECCSACYDPCPFTVLIRVECVSTPMIMHETPQT